MDLNSEEHYYPELKPDQTPTDYVREVYRRSGIFITDIFRLRTCKDKLCCNPAHFRLDITSSRNFKVRNKLINIEELSQEIDWDEFFDMGFDAFLMIFNRRQSEEKFKITGQDLLNAYLYRGLTCKSKDKKLRMMLPSIVNNDRLIKMIARELFGVTQL